MDRGKEMDKRARDHRREETIALRRQRRENDRNARRYQDTMDSYTKYKEEVKVRMEHFCQQLGSGNVSVLEDCREFIGDDMTSAYTLMEFFKMGILKHLSTILLNATTEDVITSCLYSMTIIMDIVCDETFSDEEDDREIFDSNIMDAIITCLHSGIEAMNTSIIMQCIVCLNSVCYTESSLHMSHILSKDVVHMVCLLLGKMEDDDCVLLQFISNLSRYRGLEEEYAKFYEIVPLVRNYPIQNAKAPLYIIKFCSYIARSRIVNVVQTALVESGLLDYIIQLVHSFLASNQCIHPDAIKYLSLLVKRLVGLPDPEEYRFNLVCTSGLLEILNQVCVYITSVNLNYCSVRHRHEILVDFFEAIEDCAEDESIYNVIITKSNILQVLFNTISISQNKIITRCAFFTYASLSLHCQSLEFAETLTNVSFFQNMVDFMSRSEEDDEIILRLLQGIDVLFNLYTLYANDPSSEPNCLPINRALSLFEDVGGYPLLDTLRLNIVPEISYRANALLKEYFIEDENDVDVDVDIES
jgi:hypothetical protein